MKTKDNETGTLRLRVALCIACAVCAVMFATSAAAAQRTFASADEAVSALVQALKAGDRDAAIAILGSDTKQWITSADPVADRELAQRFVATYEQKHAIVPEGDDRATLAIGADDWPFAFPLVKTGSTWHFDAEAGRHELLARRIGENELAVINVMLAIVDAQRDYASADRNKDGVREYARRFASTAGNKDGLYWPTAAGEPPSPLGELVKSASAQGYKKGDKPTPFHGYYFRMLTAQGRDAKGGAFDYIVKGRMIGGFAAVAYPAQYGNTGIMTFIVNHDGVVYQKNLGPQTAAIAAKTTRFNPDSTWSRIKP